MRRMLLALVVVVPALLAFPTRAHACYGVDPHRIVPDGTVCGYVNRLGVNNGYWAYKPAGPSHVKICPAGASPSDYRCGTQGTGQYYDSYGNSIQAWVFFQMRHNAPDSQDFDVYTWDDNYWGSSTQPVRRISVDQYGLEEVQLNQIPRPLDPTPLYPSGNSVGTSYTVLWKSGIDGDRPYTATYEVWYKYWPFGMAEPANWILSRANMPCQDNGGGPDVYGQCSTFVAGPQPHGNWAWYVVAHLDVSRWTAPGTLYTTQSGPLYFTEP
jgi:hypothetical protein